jgi:hypothetical protein
MTERVGKSCHERCLGAHDHEVDLELPAKPEQAFAVLGADSVTLPEAGDPRVARSRVQPLETWALRELPGERVLATARADDQDPHASSLLALSASERCFKRRS